jgi:hypothetical protein
MFPLPETPGVVTDCPSFAVAHLASGAQNRESCSEMFAHETLSTSSKRRIAAHYTLKHKIRYSGKILIPFFLLNSLMRIETHGETGCIHLSYTYTESLFYLEKSFLTIVIPMRVWEVAGGVCVNTTNVPISSKQ